MVTHPLRNLGRQGRQLRSEHRAHTERRISSAYTSSPKVGVALQLLERSGHVSFELLHAGASLFAINRHDRSYELCLTGEMMMNAGLADMHGIRDVGIAEAVISTDCQESPGARDDFASFGGEFDFHGGRLPTSR